MVLSPNLRGALFMVVSMAGFIVNDAITKSVVETISQGQVMLVRGVFATTMIGFLAWQQGALRVPAHSMHPMVALRTVCELGATISFLTALAHMPLANISAVLQALPLAVTMGAALFLGEMVGWRRWIAIGVGFLGVVIIVRPGFEGFNAYSLLALLSVCFCAVRDLATKRVPAEVPSFLVSLVTAASITIAGGVLIPFQGGWTPMTNGNIGLLALASVLLIVGYQFIIMSMRVGDISFIAPFRYTALLWAIVLGFVLFGDIPDTAMIVGAITVVGSGLYTLYRERKVGAHRPAAESTGPGMAPDGV
ncbi:DMT family transporter [Mesorhizobium sp. CAU 1741]|uniref:DMT family transporter n=1 Tax=Mesorhizobium sp. CAU 1741 TaxID=3140366 RepID=UPI00325BBB47